MLPHRQTPDSLNTFRAKLRPLLKPQVWGTVTVLSAVGFGTWAYYNHPEWLALTENQQTIQPTNTASETQPDLSVEDKAIGADIDNLSVLQQDLTAAEAIPLDKNPETSQTDNLFDDFIKNQEAAKENKKANLSVTQDKTTANTDIPNPVGIKAAELWGKSGTSANSNSIGIGTNTQSTGSITSVPSNSTPSAVSPLQTVLDPYNKTNNNSTTLNSDRTPSSPLQSALDRVPTNGLKQQDSTSNQSPTTIPGQTTAPVSPYSPNNGYSTYPSTTNPSSPSVPGTTGYNVPPYTNNNPPNSYTYLNQPQPVQVNPSLTPATSSNSGQSPFQNSIPSNGYNNPGYNPNFSNPGLPTTQTQQPSNFSVPNSVPGRYIGGGQINTFSNP